MRILLIAALLSSLFYCGCAGKPPAMERRIKVYNGAPEYVAVCRTPRAAIAAHARAEARTQAFKQGANDWIKENIAPEELECVPASSPEFARFVGIPAEDFGVLLRYQETLINRCERWKP